MYALKEICHCCKAVLQRSSKVIVAGQWKVESIAVNYNEGKGRTLMKAKAPKNRDYQSNVIAEHETDGSAPFPARLMVQARTLGEKILKGNNLNRAYKKLRQRKEHTRLME